MHAENVSGSTTPARDSSRTNGRRGLSSRLSWFSRRLIQALVGRTKLPQQRSSNATPTKQPSKRWKQRRNDGTKWRTTIKRNTPYLSDLSCSSTPNEQTNKRTNEHTNKQTNEQTNKRSHRSLSRSRKTQSARFPSQPDQQPASSTASQCVQTVPQSVRSTDRKSASQSTCVPVFAPVESD